MSAATNISLDDRDLLYPHQWMLAGYSGKRFWPLHLEPRDVSIDDIALSLSIECRFGGHTKYPIGYSVAQHSVFVASLVSEWTSDPHIVRAALLHDAHEAYLKDIPSPIKRALGLEVVKPAERRADAAIAAALGFDQQGLYHPLVKRADMVALATEKRDLRAFRDPPELVRPEEAAVEPHERTVVPMPSEAAKWEFLRWYDDLNKALRRR
jgi:hypothetical protein